MNLYAESLDVICSYASHACGFEPEGKTDVQD